MSIIDLCPPIGTFDRLGETTTLYDGVTVGLTVESARRVDTTQTISILSCLSTNLPTTSVDSVTPVEDMYTLLPGSYLISFNEKIAVSDNVTLTTSLRSDMAKCGCFSVEAGGAYVLHVASKVNIHMNAPIAYVQFADNDNFFQRLYKKVVTLC